MTSKDLRTLGAAAISLAMAGCGNVSEAPNSEANPASALIIPSQDGGPPIYCVPVTDTTPVVHSGLLAKKRGGPKGPGKPGGGPGGGGGGTVGGGGAPALLGAPPLQSGVGPETADACEPASALLPGIPTGPGVVRECFFGADPTPEATVERVIESVDDTDLVHVRVTFNPHFVDNSYGDTAIGWENSKKGTHTFRDLVGSDHVELLFANGQNDVALHVKLDYLSEDASQPSGYGTLGVSGGEGRVLVGNPAHVREVATSIDRNLNGCGEGSYLTSSPASDAAYTPNPAAPNWDFRVVYELWVAAEAFGSSGFGDVVLEFVHASPSKTGENTVVVVEKPCPPDEPPGGGTGGDNTGGTSGGVTGGTSGTGGDNTGGDNTGGDNTGGGNTGGTGGGNTGDGGTGGTGGDTTGGSTGHSCPPPPPPPTGCPPGTVPGDPPVEPPVDAGFEDIPDVI